MAYKFNFDLTKLSQAFFKEIATFSRKKEIHKRMGNTAKYLVKKFKIDKIVGIPVTDALTVVEDMLDTYIKNISSRDDFQKTEKRVLFLPHCSRKYMDNRCQAKFNPKFSSYECMHCSKDCLVNKATKLGKKKGYDVYVLPGGSCIKKILSKKSYEGIVGVACTEEIKLARELLKDYGFAIQGVPLIKNGCANTKFKMETLEAVL